ncbi:MAG: hypothetical protein EPN79_10750 [Burkholderiaceae bacterium]|nr:MAG: hypothetical protein EPN79_10750 [Burkholderiaceae bacterium]TBR76834.1 MAG: hypothetical protein EPN64_06325 [Burkholderiaceae bacterium]
MLNDGGAERRNTRIRAKLPPGDQIELRRFDVFLNDATFMGRGQLYEKHQEYLGLSDADLAAAKRPSE